LKARIIQYRRARHHVLTKQYLLEVEGVKTKAEAQKLVGKQVVWKSTAGTKVMGRITAPHGSKGTVRAKLERGLPGQALGTSAKVE